MSAEKFQPKDTRLSIFTDEITTFTLALLTLTIPGLISQFNYQIGVITFAAGGASTAISFIAGRNRHTPEDNFPKKPLRAENPPITVVSLNTAGSTA